MQISCCNGDSLFSDDRTHEMKGTCAGTSLVKGDSVGSQLSPAAADPPSSPGSAAAAPGSGTAMGSSPGGSPSQEGESQAQCS